MSQSFDEDSDENTGVNSGITTDYNDNEQVKPSMSQIRARNKSLAPLDLQQTVLQGSFLPASLLAQNGSFNINKFVFDPNQDSKLVHYLGHFGNVKALKFFINLQEQNLDLGQEDQYGQTIVHYAARQGRLALLHFLNTKEGMDMDQPNCYGITPVIYTLVQGHQKAFLYLFMGGGVEIQEKMAVWATNEVIKSGKPLDAIHMMMYKPELKSKVLQKVFQSALENKNEQALKFGLAIADSEDEICTLMTQEKKLSKMIQERQTQLRYKKNGCFKSLFSGQISLCMGLYVNFFRPLFAFQLVGWIHFLIILVIATKGAKDGSHLQIKDGAIFDFETSVLILIAVSIQSMFFLGCALNSQPDYAAQKTLQSNGNSLEVMFKEMQSWVEFKKQTRIEDTCLHCLLVKAPGTHHVPECERCVENFWFYSHFYSKCIARGNIRSYFIHRMIEACLSIFYVLMILKQHEHLEVKNGFLAVIEAHYRRPALSIVALLLAEFMLIMNLQWYIELATCVSWGMTLNEYRTIEKSTQRFERITITERERKGMYAGRELDKDYYILPSVSFCQILKNWISFFCCGCCGARKNNSYQKTASMLDNKPTLVEMREI